MSVARAVASSLIAVADKAVEREHFGRPQTRKVPRWVFTFDDVLDLCGEVEDELDHVVEWSALRPLLVRRSEEGQ